MQIIPAVEIKTSALPEIKTDPFVFLKNHLCGLIYGL